MSLYKFRSGFKSNTPIHTKHKLLNPTADDITWWRERLSKTFVGLRIICPPKPLPNELFVDASTGWGIGFILDGKWLAWELKDEWRHDSRDIGWAEMVAVELAVQTLVTAKFTNCHVVMCSDKMGVTGALVAGCSQGQHNRT